jgi:Regulator of ribonuclease activity B
MGRSDEELRAQLASLEARNRAQVEVIQSYGVDLNKTRKIDLSFWAPNESAAKAFAEACTRNEMPPAAVQPPAGVGTDARWLISCPISASVTFVTTQENVTTFILFADKFDCEYDGWGTAIVEAAGPDPSSAKSS